MRISDWSSDVCSSDLVGGAIGLAIADEDADRAAADQQPEYHRHHQFDQTEPGSMRAACVQNLAGCGYCLHSLVCVMTDCAVLPPVEIGRASCRARVCQYV